jgi:hypothetical protein
LSDPIIAHSPHACLSLETYFGYSQQAFCYAFAIAKAVPGMNAEREK